MNAVYLVENDREGDFREAFENVKRTHPHLKYLFSGPWPAYNFVVLSKKSGLIDNVTQSQTSVGATNL